VARRRSARRYSTSPNVWTAQIKFGLHLHCDPKCLNPKICLVGSLSRTDHNLPAVVGSVDEHGHSYRPRPKLNRTLFDQRSQLVRGSFRPSHGHAPIFSRPSGQACLGPRRQHLESNRMLALGRVPRDACGRTQSGLAIRHEVCWDSRVAGEPHRIPQRSSGKWHLRS
jgi:hypothetical protein